MSSWRISHRVEKEMEETDQERTTRNVYQRKLAVMAKCREVKPDKKHSIGFEYVSIQNLSNHLRKFLVEEGLDVEFGFVEGMLNVVLVNVDRPEDKIASSWPIVENDKGYAYTTKFPLIRMFQIGDGEEGDEADLAQKSGEAAARLSKKPNPASVTGGQAQPLPPSSREGVALKKAPQAEVVLTQSWDGTMTTLQTLVAEKFQVEITDERVAAYLSKIAQAKYNLPLHELPFSYLSGLIETVKSSKS